MPFTVQNVIDRARQLINEQQAGLYLDNQPGLIHAVNAGIQQFYNDVLGLLRQQGPVNPHHHFVRYFIQVTDDRLDAGDQDIGPLDEDHDETLSVGIAQPEAEIGGTARHYIYRPAMPIAHVEEFLVLVSRNVGIRQGLAAWHPYRDVENNVNYVRVYVYPGRNGVPQESTPYRHIFLNSPEVLTTLTGGTGQVKLPSKYMDPIVWYMIAHAVSRERKAYDSYLALAQAQAAGVAGVSAQQSSRQ